MPPEEHINKFPRHLLNPHQVFSTRTCHLPYAARRTRDWSNHPLSTHRCRCRRWSPARQRNTNINSQSSSQSSRPQVEAPDRQPSPRVRPALSKCPARRSSPSSAAGELVRREGARHVWRLGRGEVVSVFRCLSGRTLGGRWTRQGRRGRES